MDLFWGLLIFLGLPLFFLVLFIVGIRNNRRASKERKETWINETNSYIADAKTNKKLPVISSSLMLQSHENAFLEENVAMYETRAVRKSTGGFGGFRIAKGVTVGGYSGTSESHQEWRQIDSGRLTVTNKRLYFDGSKGNRTIPMDKIMNLEVLLRDRSITISIDGRSKDMRFTVSNPYKWGCVIKVLAQVKDPLKLENVNLDIQLV